MKDFIIILVFKFTIDKQVSQSCHIDIVKYN